MLGWRRRADGTGHEGLDFKAKTGDMVRATSAGTVIFAGDEAPERFGNLVVIDHGNGWHSAYGHLSKITVKKDETVRAGERIGLAGQTGEATGPELHFEIRKDGMPVDPAPKLGDRRVKPRKPVDARLFEPLRRALKVPVWADLGILPLGAALCLVLFVVLIHYADRGGLVDHHDGHVSFLDVVYFTMISITTTGFGDIAPISDRSRLIEAVIVTPIRFAVLFIFVGAAYNYIIKRGWEKWRMARIQKQLSDHIVVLGFGVSGVRGGRTN